MIMYTSKNFKSKKEFKQAVEAWNAWQAAKVSYVSGAPTLTVGAVLADTINPRPAPAVTYFQPGPFGGNEPRDGVLYFEGPHYPQPHRWYAQAIAKDGVIVKVK
jgi:hypothetical protein